ILRGLPESVSATVIRGSKSKMVISNNWKIPLRCINSFRRLEFEGESVAGARCEIGEDSGPSQSNANAPPAGVKEGVEAEPALSASRKSAPHRGSAPADVEKRSPEPEPPCARSSFRPPVMNPW